MFLSDCRDEYARMSVVFVSSWESPIPSWVGGGDRINGGLSTGKTAFPGSGGSGGRRAAPNFEAEHSGWSDAPGGGPLTARKSIE